MEDLACACKRKREREQKFNEYRHEREREKDKFAKSSRVRDRGEWRESTNFPYGNECVQIFIWFYLFMCLRPSTKLRYINCNCNPVGVKHWVWTERYVVCIARATHSSTVTLVVSRSIPIYKGIQTLGKKLGTFAKKKNTHTLWVLYGLTHRNTYIHHIFVYLYTQRAQ